jgi:DNA-binding MarR family transcriptional regulator
LTDSEALRRAQAVRHFNRFYTQLIGALHEHLAKSAFSLTEVRVLHELSRGRAQTASVLGRNLGLDSGYLSRLLTSFERRNLITRRPSDSDARQSLIALTDNGHAAYAPLDTAAIEEVSALLNGLTTLSQEQLITAMKVIERLLDSKPNHELVTLRQPRAGDCGWLVHRQAQWFAAQYGWSPITRNVAIRYARCAGSPIRKGRWSARCASSESRRQWQACGCCGSSRICSVLASARS